MWISIFKWLFNVKESCVFRLKKILPMWGHSWCFWACVAERSVDSHCEVLGHAPGVRRLHFIFICMVFPLKKVKICVWEKFIKNSKYDFFLTGGCSKNLRCFGECCCVFFTMGQLWGIECLWPTFRKLKFFSKNGSVLKRWNCGLSEYAICFHVVIPCQATQFDHH